MFTKDQMDAFVASKYALLASNRIIKEHKEDVLRGLRDDVQSLSELALIEVCTKGCELFNLPGVKAEDYKERVLVLKGRGFLIAGIRFFSLDVSNPFISVVPGFKPQENDLPLIEELVKKEFEVFRPLSFQMTLPHNYLLEQQRIRVDRYTVLGVVEEILKNTLPMPGSDIKLVKPQEIDFYERYLEEYSIFHEQVPLLKSDVRSESYDDLKVSLQSDLLFKILINDEFAGVIAGSERDYHGLKGVSILEELLFDSFRGKGFGVYIQKEFTKRMNEHFAVLWGTISHKNQPSLRTALKNGREIIETDYFFEF